VKTESSGVNRRFPVHPRRSRILDDDCRTSAKLDSPRTRCSRGGNVNRLSSLKVAVRRSLRVRKILKLNSFHSEGSNSLSPGHGMN
jgi:hypothetical protein